MKFKKRRKSLTSNGETKKAVFLKMVTIFEKLILVEILMCTSMNEI